MIKQSLDDWYLADDKDYKVCKKISIERRVRKTG